MMDSRAYQSALQLNKHCDVMLTMEEQRLDKQKRGVYNRVFREKELLLDEYIHINIRTPSPALAAPERYRTESQSGKGQQKPSSDRSRRATSAKPELGSRQKPSADHTTGFRPQSALSKATGEDGDSQRTGSTSSWDVRADHKRPHTAASGRSMSSAAASRKPPCTPRSTSVDKPDTPRNNPTTTTMDRSQSSDTVTSKRETRDPAASAASARSFRSSREASTSAAQKAPANPRPTLKITMNRPDTSSQCYSTPGYVPKTSSSSSPSSSSPAKPSVQVRRLSVAAPENVKLVDDKRAEDIAASGPRRRSAMEVAGVFAGETAQFGDGQGASKHDTQLQQGLQGTSYPDAKSGNEDPYAFYRRALLGASSIHSGKVSSKTGTHENDSGQVNNSKKSLGTTKSHRSNGSHAVTEPPRPHHMYRKQEETPQCEQEENGPSMDQEGQEDEEAAGKKALVRRMTLDPKLVLPLTATRYQIQQSATIIPVISVSGHRATMYPNANAKVGRVVTLERRAIGWLERSSAILSSLEKIRCNPCAAPVPVASPSKTLPWTPRLNMTSPFGMLSLDDKEAQLGDDTNASSAFSAPSSARPFSHPAAMANTGDDDSDDYDVVLVPQTIQPDFEAAGADRPSGDKSQRQKPGQMMLGALITNQRQQRQMKKEVPLTNQRQRRLTMGVPYVNVRRHQAASALPGRRSRH